MRHADAGRASAEASTPPSATMCSPGSPRRSGRCRRAGSTTAGLGAVRGDHPASRILSDPDRDRDLLDGTAATSPPDRRPGQRGDRVRLGRLDQDPDPAPRASIPPPTCRSTLAANSCARPPTAPARSSRTCRSTRSRPISSARSPCPTRSRPAQARLLPGLDDRQSRRPAPAVDLLRAMKETLGPGAGF